MRIRITFLLFAVMLAACGLTYGQLVTSENYKKAVDYLNCKLVELSLQHGKNQSIYESYKNEVPCDGNTSSDAILQYLKKIDYKKTIELSREIETLKAGYNGELKLDDAIVLLTENIFNDKTKYPELLKFADSRKSNVEFGTFKNNLKSELRTKFSALPATGNKEKAQIDDTEGKNLVGSGTTPVNNDWWNNYGPWALFIVFIISLGALIMSLMLLGLRQKQKDLETRLDALLRAKGNSPQAASGRSGQVSSYQTNNLTTEIQKVADDVDKLQNSVDSLRIEFDADKNKRVMAEAGRPQEIQVTPSGGEIFYLSIPSEDGSFNNKYASSSYKEGASIYRFTKTSYNHAEFQIDERESSVKGALEFPDKNIDPVCEAQNAFDSGAGRIVTIQGGTGRAELVDDKWIVTRKAKITYEH